MITVMITAAGAGAAGAMWDSIVNKSTLENLSHRHESHPLRMRSVDYVFSANRLFAMRTGAEHGCSHTYVRTYAPSENR